MKLSYLSLAFITLFTVFTTAAQTSPNNPPKTLFKIENISTKTIQEIPTNKLATCTSDTVRYVRYGKATDFLGITMNVPSEFAGYSQYYEAPQTINVSGIVFYAGVNSVNAADTAVVKCRVYTANPDSTLGTVLTEKDITVYNNYFPSNIDVMKYVVNFDSIAVCNQAYYVSIWTETTLPLGIMTDDYNANDGQGEALAWWYWTGDSTWYASGQFFAWDVDWLIEPIVDYQIDNTLTLTVDSICVPDNVCSITTRSPIFESRMYNQDAFQGTPELSNQYDWGDGAVTSGFDTCHTYSVTGNYDIAYNATMNGWTSTCVTIAYDSVFAQTTPVASFTSVSSLFTADFTNTSIANADSVLWDFGDGLTTNIGAPSHVYASAGSYNVCLTVFNACGSDTWCDSIVIDCPAPTATFSAGVTSSTVSFTDGSVGNTIASWSWDFGDSNTSTLQNPSHTYASDGTYLVCLEITDDCGSQTFCDSVTINTAGINSNSLTDSQITVFPNPSNGAFNLLINLNNQSDIDIVVTDTKGRLIYSEVLSKVLNNTHIVDLEDVSNGVYYLSLTSNTGRIVKTLSVLRKE
jgi:PKD repeat protein